VRVLVKRKENARTVYDSIHSNGPNGCVILKQIHYKTFIETIQTAHH